MHKHRFIQLAAIHRLSIWASAAACFLLGACAGGAASGGARPIDEAEYAASGGLHAINAAPAYQAGYTGQGVVVALIDGGGVDSTHPDLSGQIIDSFEVSGDTVTRQFYGVSDGYTTATQHAGLIVAKRNDQMILGTAFDARLLAINDSASNLPSVAIRLAAGLNPDFQREADIIFLPNVNATRSLADMGTTGAAAFIDAVQAGKLFVVPAGHDHLPNPELTQDSFALAPELKGQVLIVGGVDQANNHAVTQPAGGAASAYVVAPAVGITSTLHDTGLFCFIVCTRVRPETFTALMSPWPSIPAAYGAGVAAVVKQAFPYLSSAEIVQIILLTATDLGDPGVDPVYGHGLINLEQAIKPIGDLSVPLTVSIDGAAADVGATTLMLGPAFGDALSGNQLLSRAVALDDFARTYSVGLDERVQSSAHRNQLANYLVLGSGEMMTLSPWNGSELTLGLRPTETDEDGYRAVTGATLEILAGEADYLYAITGNSAHVPFASQDESEALFADALAIRMPQFALLGQSEGAAWKHSPDDKTRFAVGWFLGEQQRGDVSYETTLVQALLSHDLANETRIGIGGGLLSEQGALLASQPQGAFGTLGRTDTSFASLAGHWDLTSRFALEASYTHAWAVISAADHALLDNWSDIEANAASLSLVARGILVDSDLVGIMLSQPLRVVSGSAQLTVPVGRDMDGNLVQESALVSLSPSGRETDLQLVYRRALTSGAGIATYLLIQNDPGHSEYAPTAGAIGTRFDLSF